MVAYRLTQVFYPVEKSCVAKLPWFPSTLGRFRKSLAPAWGGARRVPFGLTQVTHYCVLCMQYRGDVCTRRTILYHSRFDAMRIA